MYRTITVRDKIISGSSNSASAGIISSNGTLDYSMSPNPGQVSFRTHSSCSLKGQLFEGQLFADVESPPDLVPINEVSASAWSSNPNCGGHIKAIGVAEFDMSSTLLSNKIELFIQHAYGSVEINQR